MSAGICGKRVGFEDIFGSTSSQDPSTKRSRCSPFGSPARCSDFGFGSEDKLSILFRMFPSIDQTVLESVLDSHDNKIDDAIKNLHALCIGNGCPASEAITFSATVFSNDNAVGGGTSDFAAEQTIHVQDDNSENWRMFHNGSSWVDLFVREMMCASNWDDVRVHTTEHLEALEESILAHSMTSKEEEIAASLKQQLHCVLRDNTILKKGIQIQQERNLEQEEKLKEAPQLKHFMSQCQEQIRKLETNNYTLKVYLQRALDSNFVPGHLH